MNEMLLPKVGQTLRKVREALGLPPVKPVEGALSAGDRWVEQMEMDLRLREFLERFYLVEKREGTRKATAGTPNNSVYLDKPRTKSLPAWRTGGTEYQLLKSQSIAWHEKDILGAGGVGRIGGGQC
jgi:hypothetical protein